MPGPTVTKAEDRAVAALTRAIYEGKTETALALISPGLPFDHVAREVSHTPLLAAIEQGNMAVFEALLAGGAGIGAVAQLDETPLHAAARAGHEAMVVALLGRGADVNAPIHRPNHQYHGRTPLMEAAIGRNLAVVKLLLARGADPFAKDVGGWTALGFAEMTGKRIATHLRKVMTETPSAAASLHDAARYGLLEPARAALDRGEAVDARDQFGRTPLHWAAHTGKADLVRLLLDRGADANARDGRGFVPLSLVESDAETVRRLLAGGADANADLGGGMTPLLSLATFRSPEVLSLLIDAGGNLGVRTADGQGILDHAASNSPRARKFLRERLGVAPDAFDALHDHMKELPKLAKAPAFQAAAERLGRLFNRKPAPWKRRKGVVYFYNVSLAKHLAAHYGEAEAKGAAAMDQASRLLARLQDEVLAEGFVLAFVQAMPEDGRMPLILLPTADKYAALLACGTNGINHGHDTAAVIAWLKDMEKTNRFHLGGCGHDFLHGRFAGPIEDADAVAARMIEFCPDIDGPAHAVAREMTKTGWFGFWWD